MFPFPFSFLGSVVPDVPVDRIANAEAMSFNGTDQYVDAGNDTSLQITGNITISAWVNIGALSSTMRIVNKDDGSNRAWIMLVVGGKIRFTRFYTASSFHYMDSSVNINDSAWHHVVCVNDSTGTAKIFIDGSEDTATTGTNTGSVLYNAAVNLKIGGGFTSQYLNGSIDEVAIFNTALSANKIQQIYDATAVVGGVPQTANLFTGGLDTSLVYWNRMGDS